jgi:hypothetical protein
VNGTPNEPRNSRGSFGAGIFDDSAELDRIFHFARLEDVCCRGAQRIFRPSRCRAHATTAIYVAGTSAVFPALRRKHFHGRYSDHGAIEQRTAREYAPMPRPLISACTRRSTRTLRTSRKVDEPGRFGSVVPRVRGGGVRPGDPAMGHDFGPPAAERARVGPYDPISFFVVRGDGRFGLLDHDDVPLRWCT